MFKNTAFRAVLRFYLPKFWMDHEVISAVTCSSYLAYLFALGAIQVDHIILSIFIIGAESKYFLETSYINGNVYKRIKSFQRPTKYENNQNVNLHKAVKTYRMTFLIWRELCAFGCILFPTLMFSSFAVTVVCTF